MMKFTQYLAVVVFVCAFISCSTPNKGDKEAAATEKAAAQKEMLVYGSNTCDHCINFKKKMDSLGVKYTFFDVEVDQSKANEMLRKLEQARYIGNISFPVVDIEGRVMVNPDLNMVMSFVRK